MIDNVVAALGLGLNLTDEEIADVLWLAVQMQQFGDGEISEQGNRHEALENPVSNRESPKQPAQPLKDVDRDRQDENKKDEPNFEIHSKNAQNDDLSTRRSDELQLKIPDARSLQEPLELARSLRPLMRRVPSQVNTLLDEEATVRRIAEEKIWCPVLRPALEPWLDLALVIDDSASMLMWRHTIAELQHFLSSYGVFRDVRVWRLGTDNTERVCIYAGATASDRQGSPRSPSELIEANGRGLVLVVSDCIAPIWRNGAIASALQVWSRSGMAAILQMLPDWLWGRTALGRGVAAQFSALAAGIPNYQLTTTTVSTWYDIDLATSIKIPVVTLEPEKFTAWAEMLAGKGGVWSAGIVFEPELFAVPEVAIEFDGAGELDAEDRVQSFRLSASPIARRLAGLLAAAPVISLPIVRILQSKVLTQSQPVHVAEVFLGGLLKPLSEITAKTNPNYVQYDFIEGVRDLLLESVPSSEIVNVVAEVSEYIAERLGISLEELGVIIRNPRQAENNELVSQTRPFAILTAQILKRLGAEYARFVEDVEEANIPLTSQVQTTEKTIESIHWSCEKTILGHEGNVTCVCFSPDGKEIVSSSNDNTLRLWDLQGNQIGQPFLGHWNSVWSVAFSPDGTVIISGGAEETLRLWDLQGNQIGQPFLGHGSWVNSVAFSPDGKALVSGSGDNTLRLWDLQGNQIGQPFLGHEDKVRSVAFSPDGKAIVSGSRDNTLRLWDLQGNQIGQPFLWHKSWVNSVAFSPDGRVIASAGMDKTVCLWDLQGNLIGIPLEGHEGGVNSVAFSPDGQTLVSCSGDKSIKIWRKQNAEKTSVKRKVLNVPYFSQMSNRFNRVGSSQVAAIAMVLNYHGIQPQDGNTLPDELHQWFEENGENRTESHALERLYRAYGFDGGFSTKRTWVEITAEIDSDRPVIVAGEFLPSGHVICIIGYDYEGYIVHDPNGTYSENVYMQGEKDGIAVHYSYELMQRLCDDESAPGIWSHFIIPRAVTAQQILAIVPDAEPVRVDELLPHLNRTMVEFRINTRLRQAYFIETITHESVSFNVLQEFASGKAYEGRSDLGNTNLGDGARFKGRGLMMITGRTNYQDCGNALGIDLIAYPERLADYDLACRSSGWIWSLRRLNEQADKDNAYNFYRAIGVIDLRQNRLEKLERAKRVLLPIIEVSLKDELRSALNLEDEQEKAKILAGLIARSPETSSQLLEILLEIEDELKRISTLIVLIPHFPVSILPILLNQSLDIAVSIENEDLRAQALVTLIAGLPLSEVDILQKILNAAKNINDIYCQSKVLVIIASRLSHTERELVLLSAFDNSRQIESESYRSKILVDIVDQILPSESQLLQQAFDHAKSLANEYYRSQVLESIVIKIPPTEPQLLQHAIDAATNISDEDVRSKIVALVNKKYVEYMAREN